MTANADPGPFAKACLIFHLVFGVPVLGLALPNGGNIIAGSGSISQPSSNSLTIQQNTQQLITNWDQFSIAAGQSVNFNQPGASSVALNRVIGQDPSLIFGSLTANGQVFLTNPSGVLFGAGSKVNVHGLIATTLGISDQDFLNGTYNFNQEPNAPLGSVVNKGTISASGYAGLLAPGVSNEGTITANLGSIALGSGTAATLDFDGDGLIKFAITGATDGEVKDTGGNTLYDRILNSGLLQAGGGQVQLTARSLGNVVRSVINQEGIVEADTIVNRNGRVFLDGGDHGLVNLTGGISAKGDDAGESGGEIQVNGEKVYLSGARLDASGRENGGAVQVQGARILNAGTLLADAVTGNGGSVETLFTEKYIAMESALASASSATGDGGTVTVSGAETGTLFSSGTHRATGGSRGGAIELTGSEVTLIAASADASGELGGGTIRVGGGFQGTGDTPRSQKTIVSSGTTLTANTGRLGDGGSVVVWSDGQTDFFGTATAKGGTEGGNGGQVEVSGKDRLAADGTLDVTAPAGLAGTILFDPMTIIIDDATGQFPSLNLVDPNANGTDWGETILTLSGGNIAVTDASDDFAASNAGAVYLYDGATGALISTLTGTRVDDKVGSDGITALSNGNYVVSSSFWDNGTADLAGAVTFGDGTTGISGAVSDTNSLVGTRENDLVGFGGIRALTNGNYVVTSTLWDNGTAVNVGAVTFGNGTTGISGEVSATNSLVGTQADDQVGNGGTIALTNGNYVVRSQIWNNGTADLAGAVTFGDGTDGVAGEVSAENSLVGTQAGDRVGFSGIIALSNGNYVVISPFWNNGAAVNAGAVTFGSGTAGVAGEISSANSIMGTRAEAGLEVSIEDTVNNTVITRFSAGGASGSGRIALFSSDGSPGDFATFASRPGSTLSLTSAFVEDILNMGSNVTLQASNDLSVASDIIVDNPGGDGGNLVFQAGRSVLINADITTDNGDFTVTANETLANGVVDADRSSGAAVIAMMSGTTIDAGTGAASLTLADGAGKTNRASGDITLSNITAETIRVFNQGADAGDIVINNASILTANAAGNSMILAAVSGGDFINNASAGALVAASGRWLVYSATPDNDTLNGLTADTKRYNTVFPAIPGSFGTADDGFLYSNTSSLPDGITSLGGGIFLVGNMIFIGGVPGTGIGANDAGTGVDPLANSNRIFTYPNNSLHGMVGLGPGGGSPRHGYQHGQGWENDSGWTAPWNPVPRDLVSQQDQ